MNVTKLHLTETERKASPHEAIGHPLQELSILRACGFSDSTLKAGLSCFYGPAPMSELECKRQIAVKLQGKFDKGKASEHETWMLNKLLMYLAKHHVALIDTIEDGYFPALEFEYAPHDAVDAMWQRELSRIARAVGLGSWILPEARLVIRPEDATWRDKGCESDKAIADWLDSEKAILTGLTGNGGSSSHLVAQREDMLADCVSMELLRMAEHSEKTGAPFGMRQKSDGDRLTWFLQPTQLLANFARVERRQTAKAVHRPKTPVTQCPLCEGSIIESHVYRLRCTADVIASPILSEDDSIMGYSVTPATGAYWHKTSQAPDCTEPAMCLQWTKTSTNLTCSRCHIGIPADYDNHVVNVTDAAECPDYHGEALADGHFDVTGEYHQTWISAESYIDSESTAYNQLPLEELIADQQADVLAQVERSESAELIRAWMQVGKVSDTARRVIELTLANLPDEDIAKVVGIEKGNVSVIRHRATKTLRGIAEKYHATV